MIRRSLFALIFATAVCGAVFAADDTSKGSGAADREEISFDSARKDRMAPINAQPERSSAARATIDIGDASLPKPASAEKIETAKASVTPPPAPEKKVSVENAPSTKPALEDIVREMETKTEKSKPSAIAAAPVKLQEKPVKEKPSKKKPKKIIWRLGWGKTPKEEGADLQDKAEETTVSAPPPATEEKISAEITPTATLMPIDAPAQELIGELKAESPVKAAEPVKLKEKGGNKKPEKVIFKWRTQNKKGPTKEEEINNKIEGRSFKGETGFTTVKTYKNKGIKVSGPEPKVLSPVGVLAVLNIDDCIKIAEANNIQAMVAKKSIKLAEMRLFEARRNMLPAATIVVERSKGRVSGADYLGRKQYIEGQQPIFHGGELYFAMKQAEANLQISKNDYNRVKNELVLQVKKAYYTLEKARENSKLQNMLSKEVEKFYNVSSKGYEAGVVARIEYLNVNSQESQVKYQLTSAEGDVSVAELMLRQAMNVNPREKFNIIPSPGFKKITLDFEKTIQDAFMNRPEIKANFLMVTYYNYGKGIANAKSLPKVDLLGQWGLAWEDYVPSDFTPSAFGTGQDAPRRKLNAQWYAGIKASVPYGGNTAEYSYTREQWTPVVQTVQGTEATTNSFKFKILDRLDMYSDKQLADIDYDRSRQEMNKTKNDVTLEVREGCFNYEKALVQLETATNKVKYQETDSELMRMKRGMDEVQDSSLIDSLIKVAQEKFGYVQAVTDCKTALASLEKAVGVQDYFKRK